MAASSKQNTQVGIPVVVTAVVVLALFMFWLYRANFKTIPSAKPIVVDKALLLRLAQQCQGDFSKLSPQDQARVNAMTGGYGVVAIGQAYRAHGQ